MPDSRWLEISCSVPESMADLLADFLLELTGNGVSIENRVVDTFNVADIAAEEVKSVKAYLPEGVQVEDYSAQISAFLATNGPDYPGFSYAAPLVSLLNEEDWANSWKINFKPTRIGERLVIKPSWEEYLPLATDIVLELDPGMAFGTGTHATTRLCLEALEKLVFKENAFSHDASVLDVGCGSGVLGIAAALFGAKKVTAVDIDPIAVTVTSANAVINGVDRLVTASTSSLSDTGSGYAIVLANILAEDLVRMRSELLGRMRPGGYLILSGILDEREEYVINGFSDLALQLQEVIRQDEWVCLIYWQGI